MVEPSDVLQPRQLTDPRALRAIAHPVRIAIIEQLAIEESMTATQLADRIDETPANCSWHLRKLAEHGFVEEAGGGTGRERPWRSVQLGMSWNESDQPEAVLAGEALSQVMIEREVARYADARARLRGDTETWRNVASSTQSMAWLTAAELEEINVAVRELFTRHLNRFRDRSARPEGARLCALMQWGVPTYGVSGDEQ